MNLESDLPLGQTLYKCNMGVMSSFREWMLAIYPHPQNLHVRGSFEEIAKHVPLKDAKSSCILIRSTEENKT